jgi:alpha-glucosidase (family GH31 glycosyl hydrolase)
MPAALLVSARLVLAASIVVCLCACGSGGGSATPSLRLEVGQDPFRLTLVRDGKTVVAQNRDARLRYQLASTGEQFALTKVTAQRGDAYDVAKRTSTGFRVSVRLKPETGVEQVYDAFDSTGDEHFLGGGERGAAVDLRGQVLPVKLHYRCSYAPVPFFASSHGWGLRLATDAVAGLAFPGSQGGAGCSSGGGSPGCAFPPLAARTEVCVRGARLDYDLYAGTLPQVLARYEADAGKPRVPPLSELALTKWRDVVDGPNQVLEDIARLRAAHVPVGSVIVDNPWETCVGSLQFDPARFPDPAALIDRVHRLGVRFLLWVSPKVVCSTGYPPGSILGGGSQQVLDLRDPAVVAEFRSRLRKLAALGVDGVKGDRGDEVELEAVDPTLQNRYARLFAGAVLPVFPDGPSIFRAASMGSQRLLPGLWAGDQPGDWGGLRTAVRMAQTAAMSGFPTWGSDVGGYASSALTADVLARWAQLGAVSPILEVGGIGPNATPWQLGPEAMTALRRAAELHYALVPYLHGLLRRRQPVLRPLGFGYPNDAEAWKADLELLVGPSLLAAPVTGPGTSPGVYLPKGVWIDVHRGARERGGRSFVRPTRLDELPLYVRDGAVIPFNLRTERAPWWGVDELSSRGRAGWLATPGATLALRAQPRDVQIFVPAPSRPAEVTIGGRTVPWTWSEGPLRGAVVRTRGPVVEGRVELR